MVVLEHVFAVIGVVAVVTFLTVMAWLFRHAKDLTPAIKHITKVLNEEVKRLNEERQKAENHDA